MFWQFIGLYGEEYGVLNHLDEIDGRHTQNAAFLKMEDFDDFMDSGFYRTIFANTAAWLEELDRKQCCRRGDALGRMLFTGQQGAGAEAWDFFGCQMMRRL